MQRVQSQTPSDIPNVIQDSLALEVVDHLLHGACPGHLKPIAATPDGVKVGQVEVPEMK